MKDQKNTGYPSIDKPWLKYYSEAAINGEIPKCTVFRNIYNNNKRNLSEVAIKYFGNQITYEQLFNKVDECSKSLINLGINKGDCIAICAAAVPEVIYLMLSCSKIGAIANFINPLFTNEQKINLINNTNATLMFVLDEMTKYVDEIIEYTCIQKTFIIPVSQSMSLQYKLLLNAKKLFKHKNDIFNYFWNDFIKHSQKKIFYNVEVEYEENRGCIMVYSSGTTGASKGILLTNDGINATIAHYNSDLFSYKRGDIFYAVVPVWFSTGNVLDILMPLQIGITVVPELVFNKKVIVNGIKKYKPAMTLISTSMWLGVVNSSKFKKTKMEYLKYPITGGEIVTENDEKIISDFFTKHGCSAPLIKGYGMCELGSTVTTNLPIANKIKSAGIPIKGVTVSAFDIDTNKELKYNQRGEIRVISPARMKEYYKNLKETEKFFVDNKWACTGDVGYIDEDGFLFVEGRMTDSFETLNGKRIYLFDIENVALNNKKIKQCKAVAIKIHNEIKPVIHIVLQNINMAITEELIIELNELFLSMLPDEAIPIAYKFRNEIPVYASGKRNIEAMKKETEGFWDKRGDSIYNIFEYEYGENR